MYRVFIPTRGRVDTQVTRELFSIEKLVRDVTYVVPKSELKYWKHKNVQLLVVPDKFKFSEIRQFILSQQGDYHVVIDDDLRPSVRMDSKLVDLRKFEIRERVRILRPLFLDIGRLLEEGWLHGGVSAREGNNRIEGDYKEVTREMRFHFYNAKAVRELGFDFTRTVTKQDFDFTLWMLQCGFPNIVIYNFAHDQCGSNSEGGCSRYRTEKLMKESAHHLAELHPDFVKVVIKSTKVSWGGGCRVDVRMKWKKAYEKGLDYVKNLRRQDSSTLDDKDRTVLRLQSELQLLSNR